MRRSMKWCGADPGPWRMQDIVTVPVLQRTVAIARKRADGSRCAAPGTRGWCRAAISLERGDRLRPRCAAPLAGGVLAHDAARAGGGDRGSAGAVGAEARSRDVRADDA